MPLGSMGGNQLGSQQQQGLSSMGQMPNVDQPKLNTGYITPSTAPVSSIDKGQPYMSNMQDAYYNQATSRLDPQWNQRQQGLESQLANMGLTRGSEAWNREMQNMSLQRNDAYGSAMNSAILNSGAEAARLQGMDINAGNFANQAAQQNYQNQLMSQQAQNTALGQQFTQGLASASLGENARQANMQNALGWGGLANTKDIAGMNIGSQEKMQGLDIASKYGLQSADIANQQKMQQAGFGQQTAMQGADIASKYGLQSADIANQQKMQQAGFGQQTGMQQAQIAADQQAQAAGFANAKEMQQAGFGQQTSMQQAQIAADQQAQAAGFANAKEMQQAQIAADQVAQQAGFANAKEMQQVAVQAEAKLAEGQQLTQKEIAAMNAASNQAIAAGNNAATVSAAQAGAAPGMANAAVNQGYLNLAGAKQEYDISKDMYLTPLQIQGILAQGGNPADPNFQNQAIAAPGQGQGLATTVMGNNQIYGNLGTAAGELYQGVQNQTTPSGQGYFGGVALKP